jgi:hypothetical protein
MVLFQAAKSAIQSTASATNHHQVNITYKLSPGNTKQTNSDSKRFFHGGKNPTKGKTLPFLTGNKTYSEKRKKTKALSDPT